MMDKAGAYLRHMSIERQPVLKIGVLGLGVGYALSCALAEARYVTVGLDMELPFLLR